MTRPYQVWYNGKLASVHLTRMGAQAQVGKYVLRGYEGAKFLIKEDN